MFYWDLVPLRVEATDPGGQVCGAQVSGRPIHRPLVDACGAADAALLTVPSLWEFEAADID